jgi:hypothetical protein
MLVPHLRGLTVTRSRLAVALLALLAACDRAPTTGVEQLRAASDSDASGRRLLIDASRDGGVWWFPQWEGEGEFDSALPHQGQALADSLRATGYAVRELPRPYSITAALLDSFDVVVRSGVFGRYAPGEIAAYERWVRDGGRLLLAADHMRFAPPDDIGLAFGLRFAGITRGDLTMTLNPDHPVTAGLGPQWYAVGSGLLAWPESAVILGRLTASAYLDLDDDDVRDENEPTAPAVFGLMRYGAGRIVFCGDLNLWQTVPRPLLPNVMAWLEAGEP